MIAEIVQGLQPGVCAHLMGEGVKHVFVGVLLLSAVSSVSMAAPPNEPYWVRYAVVGPSGTREMGDRECQSQGWCSIFNDDAAGVHIKIQPWDVGGSNFQMTVSCDRFPCSLEGGKSIAQLNAAIQPMKMTFYQGGVSRGLELRRGDELGKLIMMVKR
jgi:hypothetical protein